MSGGEMNTNLDVRSKKRKKPRGEHSKKVSVEFSNDTHKNTIENSRESSFNVNVEKKQKSKKFKLTEDVVSESVSSEIVPNENDIAIDRPSKKNKKSRKSQIMNVSAEESIDNGPILDENEKSLSNQSGRKKKKTKNLKTTVDSTPESIKLTYEQSASSSNLLTGEEGKKKSQMITMTSTGESDNKLLTLHVENDAGVSQRKKKSVVDRVSTSNAIDSKKSKKKKFKKKKFKKDEKKKKFKKKNESKNSPSEEENLQNSDAASSRSEKAILYLETWKNDRNNWKFVKLTQLWLFKNMFDKTKVPNETFEILLEYLVDLQGKGKDFVIELCESVIKKKEEMQASDEEDIVLECAYERARSILQYLQ